MPIYRWTETDLVPLDKTTLESEGKRERELQDRLRDHPEVLEEGLFILAEEYRNWEETNRRIDLLALDEEGKLVVVELKRSNEGLMDLQAIRYAALVAGMTMEQAAEAHRRYLEGRGRDASDAESRIEQHLSGGDEEASIDSRKPRIILAATNFSKELTTSVCRLNEFGMNVTCVRLELYRSGNELYLDGTKVIPVPEVEQYIISIRGGGQTGTETPRPPKPTTTHRGTEKFREAIETARPSTREKLRHLLDFAAELERERLATLWTRVGSYNTVLQVRLPGTGQALFYVYKNEPGWGYVQFSGRSLERHAPFSKAKLEVITEKPIGHQTTQWEIQEGFLDALADAYREATGQLAAAPTIEEKENETRAGEPMDEEECHGNGNTGTNPDESI